MRATTLCVVAISTEEQKKHRSVRVYSADTFSRGVHNRLEEDAPYLLELRHAWSDNILIAFDNLPSAPSEIRAEATVRHLG